MLLLMMRLLLLLVVIVVVNVVAVNGGVGPWRAVGVAMEWADVHSGGRHHGCWMKAWEHDTMWLETKKNELQFI